MPTYDDGTTPTLVTEKPLAVVTQYGEELAGTLTARHNSSPCADRGQNMVAVRIAQTSANGRGIGEELAHTVDTTGPEAVAYAVRMRAGCAGGARVRWYRKESVALWQQVTTRRYSSQSRAATSCVGLRQMNVSAYKACLRGIPVSHGRASHQRNALTVLDIRPSGTAWPCRSCAG